MCWFLPLRLSIFSVLDLLVKMWNCDGILHYFLTNYRLTNKDQLIQKMTDNKIQLDIVLKQSNSMQNMQLW